MTFAGAMARVCALLVFAGVCAAAAASAAGTDGARIVSERPLPDNGVELAIATPAFAAPTRGEVYLPAGYDADPQRRWPVTYCLHGAQGDQARFHAWYGD